MANFVYIATSLDSRIFSPDSTLECLETAPNPTGDDLGFFQFIKRVDAIVMGHPHIRRRLCGHCEQVVMPRISSVCS
jgi:hypothetical protein